MIIFCCLSISLSFDHSLPTDDAIYWFLLYNLKVKNIFFLLVILWTGFGTWYQLVPFLLVLSSDTPLFWALDQESNLSKVRNFSKSYHLISLQVYSAFYHPIFRHLFHPLHMLSLSFKFHLLLNFPCLSLLLFLLSLLT